MPLYNTVTASVSGNQAVPPNGALAETNHRYNLAGGTLIGTGGALYIMGISLQIGQSVGHIAFCNGATATTAASHWWLSILDSSYVQQGHTADQLTTNVAASTWYNLATVSPYVATYTGPYYLTMMFTVSAGSLPTPLAPNFTPVTQVITGANAPAPLYGGISSTGLTAPGTDGTTTYIAPTAPAPCYYMYCSA